MAIALAQVRITNSALAATAVVGTFASTPTVGNLMVASLTGANNGFTAPAGWLTATSDFVNRDCAIFYRVVVAGDGTGYTFTQAAPTDDIYLEMEEWGGWPAGTITLDLAASAANGSGVTSSVNAGTTANAVELVKALVGIGGSGSGGGSFSWNQSLVVDSTLGAGIMYTGHLVTGSTQSFSPTTATWSPNTHSSTVQVASWKVVAPTGVNVTGVTANVNIVANVGAISGGITGIRLAQNRVTASNPSATSIAASLATTPTVGNLMVASCSSTQDGNWTPPSGWLTAVSGGTKLNLAIFYRQVVAGDGAQQSFAQAAPSIAGPVQMELEEWTGFVAGSITVDLRVLTDANPALTTSVNAGTTGTAVELVKAVVGVGTTTATAAVWSTGGFVGDTAFLAGSFTTGHVVTTQVGAFNPVTMSWTDTPSGPHSSTIAVASFAVAQLTPVLAQPRVTAISASASTISATLQSTPTIGNVLLATCCGLHSGWTPPSGWMVAGTQVGNTDLAIFYKRVVSGDTAGPYTFTETGGPGKVELELEEYAGIPGSPAVELIGTADKASATTASVSPGVTTNAVQLVKAALGVAGGTSTNVAWTSVVTADSALLQSTLATGHAVLTVAGRNLSPITATWTNANVSSMLAVSFAFVPFQAAVAVVYRGITAFATGQPGPGSRTSVAAAAANTPTNTDTVTPGNANSEMVGLAATVNTAPGGNSTGAAAFALPTGVLGGSGVLGGISGTAETTTIVGGAQRVTAATSGPGLNPAVTVNDMALSTSTATTWTYVGNNAYNGIGELVALAAGTTVPSPPVGVQATAQPGAAVVSWAAPTSNGGSTIIDYTVNGLPGGMVVSVADVVFDANWIMGAVVNLGGNPQSFNGAIGFYPDSGGVTHIRPYQAAYACMGLARATQVTGDSTYVNAAVAHLTWYVNHLDPNGYGLDWDYNGTSWELRSSGTTRAGLSTGGAITSVPVNALAGSIPAGPFYISSAGHYQGFVTTGAAAGATSVPIASATPNFAYPSGSTVSATPYDSTDSYAAIHLAAIYACYQATGNTATISSFSTAIPTLINALGSTVVALSGLPNVTPYYTAALLQDSAESYFGFAQAALVCDTLGLTAAAASARSYAAGVLSGLNNLMWEPANNAYAAPGRNQAPGFEGNDTPDLTNQQVDIGQMDAVWTGVADLGAAGRGAALIAAVEAAQPNWWTLTNHDLTIMLLAYNVDASPAHANAVIQALRSVGVASNYAYNFTPASVGTLILSETGGVKIAPTGSVWRTPTPAVVSGASATQATVSGLAAGTPYSFAVTARNSIGSSAASLASASVTTPTAPTAAPTGVTAAAGTASAVVTFTPVATAGNGGWPIDAYRVTPYIAGVAQTGLRVSGAASPITVTGLAGGTAYTFTVAAHNAVGYGSESTASGAVTVLGTATVPSAPSGVTAVPFDAAAAVSWTVPSDGGSAITSFTVTSSPGSLTATVSGATANHASVAGLTNGTAYTFAVTATNSAGTSTAGTSAAVTPVAAATPIMPRVIVEIAFANNPTTASASLTWTDVTTYVAGTISTTTGRQHETDTFEAGTMSLRLRNFDSRFSPFNTASPYYGPFTDGSDAAVLGLVPGKPIRVRATWNGTSYPIWYGFVDAWPMVWDTEVTAYVDITCTDAFEMFNQAQFASAFELAVRGTSPAAWYPLSDAGATPPTPAGQVAGSVYNPGRYGNAVVAAGPPLNAVESYPSMITGEGVLNAFMLVDPTPPIYNGGSVTFACLFQRPPITAASTGQRCTVVSCKASGHDGAWYGFNVGLFGVTDGATGGVDGGLWATVNDGSQASILGVAFNGPYNIVQAPVRSDTNAIGHVAFTYTQAGGASWIALYLNGVFAAQQAAPATLNTPTNAAFWTYIGQGFGGNIQDAQFWNRGLLPNEIATIAQAAMTGWDGDRSDARMVRLLAGAQWPAADQRVERGSSTLQKTSLSSSVLAEANATVATERGWFFHGPDGVIRFYNRTHVLTAATSSVSQLALGEGVEPYDLNGTEVAMDRLDVYNDITVQRNNGILQRAGNAESQAKYGVRSLPVSGLLQQSDADSISLAQYLRDRYATPTMRVRAVALHPLSDLKVLFPKVLGLGLGDQVTVTRNAPGGGTAFSQRSVIERIQHTVTVEGRGDWHTVWSLSAADATRYGTLDSTTSSVLDSTAKLYF